MAKFAAGVHGINTAYISIRLSLKTLASHAILTWMQLQEMIIVLAEVLDLLVLSRPFSL